MPLLTVKEERSSVIQKVGPEISSREAFAFCPKCKAFQTIWIDRGKLIPTRKFFQEGSQIFHDCGSIQPCRLYLNL